MRTMRGATYKAILLTVLALLATAWAVTWPVRRLTAGTRRLASGDLATRVGRGGASEVGELAHAFNCMAAELADAERVVKTYQAHLEQRVEERTLQLRHLAEHDPLTGLPNRRQLFQRLNELLGTTAPQGAAGSHVAVLFLDLDNFKTVNDTLGHEFGDRVLAEIGERLRQIAGETGFIARLGGDEFTLVWPVRRGRLVGPTGSRSRSAFARRSRGQARLARHLPAAAGPRSRLADGDSSHGQRSLGRFESVVGSV